MRNLDQVLNCFPSILDWKDAYLNDGRQRILGDAPGFSVEIILGSSLDHFGIFSSTEERPEMISVIAMFLENQCSASVFIDQAREFLREQPDGIFQAMLGRHALTLSRVQQQIHFRFFPLRNYLDENDARIS